MPLPTLYLHGKRDLCLLPVLCELCNFSEDFPVGLSSVEVEAAGHFLHQEAPQTVNKLIEEWIKKH